MSLNLECYELAPGQRRRQQWRDRATAAALTAGFLALYIPPSQALR